ncbi:putative GPI-anchor transamidase subunit T [Blattamonas nauphoetae]|uniref:GPI-anchor transamidase subunit T n=1 Tax=Blattamonas nauphoetae TaxID=2049346 RepID=A0ABQ9XXI3_9EUKA|nr:putative GPI-anchor transamidase subunit T [Blattamonas nauphoetae]
MLTTLFASLVSSASDTYQEELYLRPISEDLTAIRLGFTQTTDISTPDAGYKSFTFPRAFKQAFIQSGVDKVHFHLKRGGWNSQHWGSYPNPQTPLGCEEYLIFDEKKTQTQVDFAHHAFSSFFRTGLTDFNPFLLEDSRFSTFPFRSEQYVYVTTYPREIFTTDNLNGFISLLPRQIPQKEKTDFSSLLSDSPVSLSSLIDTHLLGSLQYNDLHIEAVRKVVDGCTILELTQTLLFVGDLPNKDGVTFPASLVKHPLCKTAVILDTSIVSPRDEQNDFPSTFSLFSVLPTSAHSNKHASALIQPSQEFQSLSPSLSLFHPTSAFTLSLPSSFPLQNFPSCPSGSFCVDRGLLGKPTGDTIRIVAEYRNERDRAETVTAVECYPYFLELELHDERVVLEKGGRRVPAKKEDYLVSVVPVPLSSNSSHPTYSLSTPATSALLHHSSHSAPLCLARTLTVPPKSTIILSTKATKGSLLCDELPFDPNRGFDVERGVVWIHNSTQPLLLPSLVVFFLPSDWTMIYNVPLISSVSIALLAGSVISSLSGDGKKKPGIFGIIDNLKKRRAEKKKKADAEDETQQKEE